MCCNSLLCCFLTWIVSKVQIFGVFVILNRSKHGGKVVIKSLWGSAVTQTVSDGQTVYPPVANFLWCVCVKNYENWLAVDKVITKISRFTFFGPPCLWVVCGNWSWEALCYAVCDNRWSLVRATTGLQWVFFITTSRKTFMSLNNLQPLHHPVTRLSSCNVKNCNEPEIK